MTRPKGYMHDWNPREDTRVVIRQCAQILNEYRQYGPMTVRQIFYRLVGKYDYDKTELAYKRLVEYLVRARRAGMIPFSSIRDDGTVFHGGGGWSNTDAFWRYVRNIADGYERNHQQGQSVRVELWCEAAGMAPMLSRIASEWHVPVYSTGGFSSVTVVYETAQRLMRYDRPTVWLHVGDFDPSGESIFKSMEEDIWSFMASHNKEDKFRAERILLTRDQVEEYGFPTAPPKKSDSRSVNWFDETVQAEAVPPDLLAQIVQAEIEKHMDRNILAGVLDQEADDQKSIDRILKIAEDEFDIESDDE